jgi:hypothetical protein
MPQRLGRARVRPAPHRHSGCRPRRGCTASWPRASCRTGCTAAELRAPWRSCEVMCGCAAVRTPRSPACLPSCARALLCIHQVPATRPAAHLRAGHGAAALTREPAQRRAPRTLLATAAVAQGLTALAALSKQPNLAPAPPQRVRGRCLARAARRRAARSRRPLLTSWPGCRWAEAPARRCPKA